MLDRPMHAAAYLLSPKYLENTGALKVSEIQRGWFATISRLVPREQHALVTEQLHAFRNQRGPWMSSAVESLKGMKPMQFWETFHVYSPELAELAVRVLNLSTTTSAAERNWSEHGFVHDKRRNRLRVDR
jgi:hypothetical protein